MICKQCGGKFDEHLASCPYCGALNYSGAEEQYMEHLHDIRQEMSEMGDDAREEYNTHMKKGLVAVIGTVCGVFLLAALLLGLFLLDTGHTNKKYAKQQKAMMLWESTFYPEMDRLYAEGSFDELCEFLNEHYEDEGYNPYAWSHIDFILSYNNYRNFLHDSALFKDGNLNDMYWALYYALYLYELDNMTYMNFSEEEVLIMDGWQKEAEDFLHDTVGLSDDEIEKVREEVRNRDSGLPDSQKCRKYIQNRYHL